MHLTSLSVSRFLFSARVARYVNTYCLLKLYLCNYIYPLHVQDAGVHALSNVCHVDVERISKRKPGEVVTCIYSSSVSMFFLCMLLI